MPTNRKLVKVLLIHYSTMMRERSSHMLMVILGPQTVPFHNEGTAGLSCRLRLHLRAWLTEFQLPLPLAQCLAHRQDYSRRKGGGCALIRYVLFREHTHNC